MSAIVLDVLEALRVGFGFLWLAGWAIMSGILITSFVQVYVSKERMAGILGEETLANIGKSTVFGAASSGCSYGAVAIGKGIFRKGAHPTNVFAFMFASTNLIVELGLMTWILLGWEFLLAEIIGGFVLIALVGMIVHYRLPEELFNRVREELDEEDKERGVEQDPTCGTEGKDEYSLEIDGETYKFCSRGCMESFQQQHAGHGRIRDDLRSWGGWYKLANQYRKEWTMLYRDVIMGFFIAGFVLVFVPQWIWEFLFLEGDSVLVSTQNAFMGVTLAIISFVGSIGNVPFATALWIGGGIGFAGVIAFIYSDLITIPVLNILRKYYGWKVMLYILAVFFVTMALTGVLMELLFDLFGLVPDVATESADPTKQSFFELDYTFVLNTVFLGLSGFLFWVYWRGLGAPGKHRDPICGMRAADDGPTATYNGETYYFCSEICRNAFEENPQTYLRTEETAGEAVHG